jgi:hypothetical protein
VPAYEEDKKFIHNREERGMFREVIKINLFKAENVPRGDIRLS